MCRFLHILLVNVKYLFHGKFAQAVIRHTVSTLHKGTIGNFYIWLNR